MEFIIFLLKFDIPSINTNDLNRLFENNKFNEKAKKIASSMTYQSGGRIVSNIGDILVCQIPIDSSEKILEIKKRIEDELDLRVTIGVGETVKDAKSALDFALENAYGEIKVYHEDMDNKHEDKVATSEETEINKSEFLEKAISQETKSQVAQILSNIKSNAQAFEQLKQESPEVYQNLVDMTQSLVEIFSQDKEEQHKQLERTLKLIHVKLKEKQKKKIEDQIKFIDKKLGQFQQDKKDEDKEKHMKLIKDRMKQLREDDKKAKLAAKALGFQDMWKLFKIHGRK